MESVQKVCGKCVESVRKVCGKCAESVRKVCGKWQFCRKWIFFGKFQLRGAGAFRQGFLGKICCCCKMCGMCAESVRKIIILWKIDIFGKVLLGNDWAFRKGF